MHAFKDHPNIQYIHMYIYIYIIYIFNGKVGSSKEGNIISLFGLGERNDNGDKMVNFSGRHNLFATNTWFQQRAQHTWISPRGDLKNQIDFVHVDNRFRKNRSTVVNFQL